MNVEHYPIGWVIGFALVGVSAAFGGKVWSTLRLALGVLALVVLVVVFFVGMEDLPSMVAYEVATGVVLGTVVVDIVVTIRNRGAGPKPKDLP